MVPHPATLKINVAGLPGEPGGGPEGPGGPRRGPEGPGGAPEGPRRGSRRGPGGALRAPEGPRRGPGGALRFLGTSKSDFVDFDVFFLHVLHILTVFKHVEVGSSPKEPDFDLSS